jgi:glycosyltransferase EpsE
LTALRDDDVHVAATLESLAHSKLRDLELVVVDSGSSEHARTMVADWISEHPRIAARLVVSDAIGLGAARNVGLDFARAPSLLVLDPGQELYPRCLDVLTGTLEAMPDVAFVYPMQEVTGAVEEFVRAGGDYVLSFLGWDPGRLRAGTDIHVPALIRTARLLDLGGFATEPRLERLAERDLWYRMADRGWRGQLVPQILVRRTESESSRTLAAPYQP